MTAGVVSNLSPIIFFYFFHCLLLSLNLSLFPRPLFNFETFGKDERNREFSVGKLRELVGLELLELSQLRTRRRR